MLHSSDAHNNQVRSAKQKMNRILQVRKLRFRKLVMPASATGFLVKCSPKLTVK